ncbi:RhoGAP domain-containing protein, partial [Reticulomyxa filosa]
NGTEGVGSEDDEGDNNANKVTYVPVKRPSTQIVRTPPTSSLDDAHTQKQTLPNSPRVSSITPKRPPPPPSHAGSRTVINPPSERDSNKGNANINGSSSSGTHAFNSSKRYSGHSGGLPPPIKANKVGALPPLPDTIKTHNSPSSPLPPLSKATSLNISQGNGLLEPSSDLNDENNEEKCKPTSAVKAAVNGFDFEIKKKMSMADLHQPDYHLNSHQIKSVPKGTPKLGKLPVLAPKPQKFKEQDDKISDVTFVERTVQVTYDKDEGVFRGLPKEWEELLNKQFGVSPKHIPGVKLSQYSAKIPKVLIILKDKLVEANGYQQMGIFRLAPDVRDNNAIKSSIDSGKFEMDAQHADVNVYANLIKVWFRDLPDPLLNCVAPERVEMASKESDVIKIVSDFPEPHKSIFLWLCDMCVECAVYENVNKMGPKV